jgi:hypothetical protein
MAWDVRRPGKGNVLAPTLARAGTRCSFRSVRAGARASPPFMETGQQKHLSLRVEAGGAHPKRLRRLVTIVGPTYGFACQQFRPRKDPSRRIVSALRHKQKIVSRRSIHIANEEEQAKICTKLKEFLGRRLHIVGHAKGRSSKRTPPPNP